MISDKWSEQKNVHWISPLGTIYTPHKGIAFFMSSFLGNHGDLLIRWKNGNFCSLRRDGYQAPHNYLGIGVQITKTHDIKKRQRIRYFLTSPVVKNNMFPAKPWVAKSGSFLWKKSNFIFSCSVYIAKLFRERMRAVSNETELKGIRKRMSYHFIILCEKHRGALGESSHKQFRDIFVITSSLTYKDVASSSASHPPEQKFDVPFVHLSSVFFHLFVFQLHASISCATPDTASRRFGQ